MKNLTLSERVRFQLNFYKGCLATCNLHIEKLKQQDVLTKENIEVLNIQIQLRYQYQTIIELLETILKPEERKINK